MQRALAAIAILLLFLSLPATAAGRPSATQGHTVTAATPIDEVFIGSALTVTRTETTTWTAGGVAITTTPVGPDFNFVSGYRPI